MRLRAKESGSKRAKESEREREGESKRGRVREYKEGKRVSLYISLSVTGKIERDNPGKKIHYSLLQTSVNYRIKP
jgi:hypothetical protein